MRSRPFIGLAIAGIIAGQSCFAQQGKGSTPPALAGGPWIMSDADYPADAKRLGQQGSTKVALQIDKKGKVQGCNIIESSGSQSLDDTSCAMFSKLKFKPARDETGQAVKGDFVRKVNWALPQR